MNQFLDTLGLGLLVGGMPIAMIILLLCYEFHPSKVIYYIMHVLLVGFFINWPKQKWFRQWKGGTWYYNRHWRDAGMRSWMEWSRDYHGTSGGPNCTFESENY